MFLLPFLGQYDAFSFLSRSSGDLQTGNSRFLIWGISFAEFAQFKPIHLIGYGEYGHLGSGASKLWENIFSNWEDSGNKTPHNTMLVIMFDTGYIGLFFYISLLYGFIAKMIKIWLWQKPQRYLYLSYFLFMLLQGVTESTFGFYFFDYLFIFFMIFIVEMIDYKKITSESEEIAVTPELSLAG
jgi:O-antigen ligase